MPIYLFLRTFRAPGLVGKCRYKEGTSYLDGTYWVVPFELENNGRGRSYGFEYTASWEATEQWKLAGSYSFLICNYHYFDSDGADYIIPSMGASVVDPRNQIRIQSYWNFAPKWEFDVFFRYVDLLSNHYIPSYMTMDARLGWKPTKNLEFSIVGQNLFTPHHEEFASFSLYGEPMSEINRAVFAKMTWTR